LRKAALPTEQHWLFSSFRLDPLNEQLWRGQQEIVLRRKTFDVLRYLVEHSQQLVTKAALLDAVWPKVAVSDSMPAISVGELRRALGDEASTPRLIETVHGRGYRFIAKVTTAPAEVATAPQLPRPGPAPIFVGRETELALLRSRLQDARSGQRRVVFVAGEPGIGKTAFVRVFLDSVATEGTALLVGRGQCVEQYGAGEPYMPVLEALGRLCQEPGGGRVIEILRQFAPMWLAQMPAVVTPAERARLQIETQGITQQRMLREMTQALEVLTAEVSLVLVLEDLHWSDFSTLELISALAVRREPARLLIVATYRPVEMLTGDHRLRTMKEELELHHECEEVRLKFLNQDNVADYLARRLATGSSRQFGTLASAIHRRSDGNPLFMVNVVDYLIEARLLSSQREVTAGAFAKVPPFDRIDVPKGIRQMIERNFDLLKPHEQAVLEAASVVGAEFSAAEVAAALEGEVSEIESRCLELSRREQFLSAGTPISWPDGTLATSFRFHHALYQEVLYARVPAAHQLLLHRRIAEREEAAYGERAHQIATSLAHHYSRANHKDKAVKYFQLAARQAAGRGAVVEAEGHYRRALGFLGQLPADAERDRRELALQIGLGSALWASKSWSHPDTSDAFRRAQELGEILGETRQVFTVLLALGSSAVSSGQYKLAKELGERVLLAAERRGDRASLCAAHTFRGQTLIWRAQFADGQKHLEVGSGYYPVADPGGLASWGVDAPALTAMVTLVLGFPDRARQLMILAELRSNRRGDPFRAGMVHMWGAAFYIQLRDEQAVFEHAEMLSRLAAKQPVWTGVAEGYKGQALLLQGDWEKALGYLRRSMKLNNEVGLVGTLPWLRQDVAECLVRQGRLDEALAQLIQTIRETEENGYLRAPVLWKHANVLAQSNAEIATVEAAYHEAIDCAREQGARFYELEATTAFARWLKGKGHITEERTVLAKIYSWFTEGFDTAALRDAKTLIDETSTTPKKRAPRHA
jgi:DNA-binding winged helix-turn-helix (wHTH) protein/tetratricopeptide (TPR) repeat protein